LSNEVLPICGYDRCMHKMISAGTAKEIHKQSA